MEHTEATETHATERYLLGELTPAEIDAFEEHYFDCPECTDDVRAGMLFMEGGRQLVREKAAAPVAQIAEHRRRRWPLWVPNAAAAVMTFALAGTLLLRSPAATLPRMAIVLSSADLDATRAADEGLTLPAIAYIPIQTDDHSFSSYHLRVLGPDRKVITEERVSLAQATNPIPLTIDEGFPPGRYEVEISGVNPAGSLRKIETRQFTVKR